MLADELLLPAPTATSCYVCERLNDRPSRTQSKVLRRVGEAHEVVRSMRINVAVRRKRDENGGPERDLERGPRPSMAPAAGPTQLLPPRPHTIDEQHQQFYAPSKRGRTDHLARIARRITGEDDLSVVTSREAWAVDREGRIEAVLVLTCYRGERSALPAARRTLSVVVPRHGGRSFGE